MLKQLEELCLLAKAACVDKTFNTSMAIATFQRHGFYRPDGQLDRTKLLKLIRKDGGLSLRRHYEGIGGGAYLLLIEMLMNGEGK